MPAETTRARRSDPVKQFSVFTANRLGRLRDLFSLLDTRDVHVLALTILDTTDSAIIRFVVDEPDTAARLLAEHNFPFTDSPVLVVEIEAATELNKLMAAL